MSTKKSKCGFLMFAQNNNTINYLKIALTNAMLIKKHLNKPVTVVTDSKSLIWDENAKNSKLMKKVFDHIIISDEENPVNNRAYRDTIYYSVDDDFKNRNRSSAYSLSPYEETILIDADYLVFDSSINNVWGNSEEILINKDAIDLNGNSLTGEEYRLSDVGIRMYWATCIYFKKTTKAQMLFTLVDHIKQHWDYYKFTYGFTGSMFRNDFAFSIAIHILSGFEENEDFKGFPNNILTIMDTDQMYAYKDDAFTFFVQDRQESWKFELVKIKNASVHILNKISLAPHLNAIMKDAQ